MKKVIIENRYNNPYYVGINGLMHIIEGAVAESEANIFIHEDWEDCNITYTADPRDKVAEEVFRDIVYAFNRMLDAMQAYPNAVPVPEEYTTCEEVSNLPVKVKISDLTIIAAGEYNKPYTISCIKDGLTCVCRQCNLLDNDFEGITCRCDELIALKDFCMYVNQILFDVYTDSHPIKSFGCFDEEV